MSSGQRQQQQRRHPKASTSSSGASSSSSAHHPQHQQHQQAAAQAAAVHLLPASQLSSHTAELTTFIQTTFVPSVSPSPDEFTAKENAFAFLATLVERVAPGAKLKPFGSMANGFALQNSDMDLVCLQSDQSPPRPASDMVEELGALIQAETNFQVKMLPRARIPIIKLTMPPTSTTPFSLACDIGFDNKLALSNTKLLYTYAKCDHRLRSLVLFIKVWTKKRQINSPYRGTLSSYGYVLLVIHFLVHVKQPPVLPNLQRLPLTRNYELHELEAEGHDIYFMDDLDSLSLWWKTSNNDTVGELLVDFFRHYAHQFDYNRLVLSLRSENGYVTKESKGWHLDPEFALDVIVRDSYKLCIEDPFQTDYNVARTVTRDGLYTIRGEFMRALRVLTGGSSKKLAQIFSELMEERDDSLVPHPPVMERPSPRRKSAPSPRLGASHPPPPAVMHDFRAWAALNGVTGAVGLGRGVAYNARQGEADVAVGGGRGTGLEEAWDQLSPAQAYVHGLPISGSGSHHPSSRRGQSSGRHNQRVRSRPSSPPSLERRVSWDGSGSASTTPNGYDFHRFFQSQPGDEHPIHRTTLTAPSSPDLGSTLHYSSFGVASPYQFGGFADASSGRPSVGPRLIGTLPRHRSNIYHSPSLYPEDDLALANSITFGNFAPSYSPYPYASSSVGSSSAYGGTGHTSPTESYQALGPLDGDDDDDVEALRGRLPNGSDAPVVGIERAPRQRGRSVPHVRVDDEGREFLLFGEISAVLPRASDEDGVVDREKAMEGMEGDDLVLPAPTVPTTNELVSSTANVAPITASDVGDDGYRAMLNGPTSILSAVPELPTLTTSPPTPIKASTPIPAPASPLPMTPSDALNRGQHPRTSSNRSKKHAAPASPPTVPSSPNADRIANGVAKMKLTEDGERKGG